MGISAVVITKNEEEILDSCLSSLRFADEIVVLDSYSTDRTPEIAKRYTDRFYQREFTGFSDQKSAALELASQEWVLLVDSDEVIPTDLASEIMEAVTNGAFEAYRIARLTYFLGKPIRHCGWYPEYVLRLGKRDKLYLPDVLVHERVQTNGVVGQLACPLLHFSYRSIMDFLRKTDHYTRAAVEQKMKNGYRWRIHHLLLHPPLMFVRNYLLKLGFLDGVHGLVLCLLMSCSVVFRYAMLWEQCRLSPRQDVGGVC